MATVKIKGGEGVRRVLQGMAEKLKRPATVRVGFLEGATYPDGTPVAMVAAIQNWGAPRAGIPPRPFFTNMIADKQDSWGPATAELLARNDYDATATMTLVGEGIAGQLRQAIVDTNEPALAESTIKRKGSSKALVDSGHMLNSISYKVDPK